MPEMDQHRPVACRGATHDLDRSVRHHLFLLSPNNSGSSFLQRALATSDATWSLPREGQYLPGFAGPRPGADGLAHIWASDPQWVATYREKASHDWEKTRRAWYFQAVSRHPRASVFTTKSPPLLLVAGQLRAAFAGTRFLSMVRDPYATAVGIRRSRLALGDRDNAAILRAAARHIIACFAAQKDNRAEHGDITASFTYEDMCDDTASAESKIIAMLPALGDVHLTRTIPVKGRYREPLTNMNARQIDELSTLDIDLLNAEFAGGEALFAAFGYSLR